MGRLAQAFDYMNRKPSDFSLDFVKFNYTHFSITPELKKLRRAKLWYRDNK
jgi:hypothetical protein